MAHQSFRLPAVISGEKVEVGLRFDSDHPYSVVFIIQRSPAIVVRHASREMVRDVILDRKPRGDADVFWTAEPGVMLLHLNERHPGGTRTLLVRIDRDELTLAIWETYAMVASGAEFKAMDWDGGLRWCLKADAA